ncbi:hypothetical protein [Streptomyces sp. NRRL S-146]|uniref:hypothetical protein n=1 Tax=Streptomyces sp. NRRL S-146 TaxID=1463884 RepID=UPI00131B3B71|nr:hypothetical protein [Streptomyces sp. NRRL S-146]
MIDVVDASVYSEALTIHGAQVNRYRILGEFAWQCPKSSTLRPASTATSSRRSLGVGHTLDSGGQLSLLSAAGGVDVFQSLTDEPGVGCITSRLPRVVRNP